MSGRRRDDRSGHGSYSSHGSSSSSYGQGHRDRDHYVGRGQSSHQGQPAYPHQQQHQQQHQQHQQQHQQHQQQEPQQQQPFSTQTAGAEQPGSQPGHIVSEQPQPSAHFMAHLHSDEVLVKEVLAKMASVRASSVRLALAEADLEKNLSQLDVIQENLALLERERQEVS